MAARQRGSKRFKWDNHEVSLGIYISVPFCRTKCSYCNFASDVFSRAVFERYVDRVCSDVANAPRVAEEMGAQIEREVDSIYLGGGTPTVLESGQLRRLFDGVRQQFSVASDAEITVECAPGTLAPSVIDGLSTCGVNRVSLGVQSFVDAEAAAVGRLHKRATVLEDIVHLRAAGMTNFNIDLIAGLPHQTEESWQESLAETLATQAPHVSVYMLEVDEDSRLGREVIAGGTRYHAHFVPDEDATADFYVAACEQLEAVGVAQYEISNFAGSGSESRHNLKYWTRQPYLGFGVDAHSMLASASPDAPAVRFATADVLEKYVARSPLQRTEVSQSAALEETFFLGLRLNRGVDLRQVAATFGQPAVDNFSPAETMSTPLVSVLIDTYNHQRFIEQAIVSVLEQDVSPAEMEVIVVDDGSTDGTPDIVRKFLPRVRYLRKENGGQASAFNAGIPETQGEIVAFLDGDDWWVKDKLRLVLGAFANNPEAGAVGHGYYEVDSGSNPFRSVVPDREYRLDLHDAAAARLTARLGCFLGTSRFTVRKDVLRRILPVPEELAVEADEYMFTLAPAIAPVILLSRPLFHYRLHDDNLFMIQGNDPVKLRRKHQVLGALLRTLPGGPEAIRRVRRCDPNRLGAFAGGRESPETQPGGRQTVANVRCGTCSIYAQL